MIKISIDQVLTLAGEGSVIAGKGAVLGEKGVLRRQNGSPFGEEGKFSSFRGTPGVRRATLRGEEGPVAEVHEPVSGGEGALFPENAPSKVSIFRPLPRGGFRDARPGRPPSPGGELGGPSGRPPGGSGSPEGTPRCPLPLPRGGFKALR